MRTQSHAQAVSALAPLLRATDAPCPLVLLGAGASFRSGVPTAAEAVKQIARRVYSERVLGGSRPPERVESFPSTQSGCEAHQCFAWQRYELF